MKATATLDLDKLVRNEESAAADAARFVESAARAAGRGQPVDEAKLVEALRRGGKSAADFAAEVRRAAIRFAQLAEVARVPELERQIRDLDAEQAEDDAAIAPVLAAYRQRSADRRHHKSLAADGLVKCSTLKDELYRTQPDGDLKGRHARHRSEHFRLERELQVLRDRRHVADCQTGEHYSAKAVAKARMALTRTDASIGETLAAIAASESALLALEDEMSMT